MYEKMLERRNQTENACVVQAFSVQAVKEPTVEKKMHKHIRWPKRYPTQSLHQLELRPKRRI